MRQLRFDPGRIESSPQRQFGRLQIVVALSPQTKSQRVSQQKGSISQTASQQARSSQ